MRRIVVGVLVVVGVLSGMFGATVCRAASLDIKLGIVTTPGTAQYIAAELFKKCIEERSNGDIGVTIYHSASLGNETEILQQIQMNAIQMGIITLGPFDVFVPEVNVVAFPFLFHDYDEVSRILDGPLGQKVLDSLAQAGFKGLAFSENGFRHLTNSKHPVNTVDDVSGLKIRVMESKVHQMLWRTLGANPTPMAWPIYTELQQGTIDGQENPLSVIDLYKLYEVQKHLTLTGHVYSAHIDIANLEWFSSLSTEQQDLIRTCMREAAVEQRKWNRDNEVKFLESLKAHGMEVVEHPDKASFRKRAEALKSMDIYTANPKTAALLDEFLTATAEPQ
ncbi:TRAP transporter substrate-binding protein [Desulfovibrio inopinatus]|uniref:TRAP transporter substrate-binding protein n=1 Tax=Desulfovibrio inopinatus TaxID=102109 RepID=UPI0003FE50CB|nr:TRAP transporter substrate-binding protein [Desulfovibrio inopinatus]